MACIFHSVFTSQMRTGISIFLTFLALLVNRHCPFHIISIYERPHINSHLSPMFLNFFFTFPFLFMYKFSSKHGSAIFQITNTLLDISENIQPELILCPEHNLIPKY